VCSDPCIAALGVDVEHERGRPIRIMRLARRFFTPAELERLGGLSGEARTRHFYRLWTLKEAWVKAHGLALAPHLRQLCFEPDAAGAAVLRRNLSGRADGCFVRGELAPGVPYALCLLPTTNVVPAPEAIRVNLREDAH
jgi:phosphopantetheine--protein transferase-like protein